MVGVVSVRVAGVVLVSIVVVFMFQPVSRPQITVTQAAPPLPPPNLKAEFQAMKEREPPDSWDVEFLSDRLSAPKPSRGAATFIPREAEPKALPIRPKRVSSFQLNWNQLLS